MEKPNIEGIIAVGTIDGITYIGKHKNSNYFILDDYVMMHTKDLIPFIPGTETPVVLARKRYRNFGKEDRIDLDPNYCISCFYVAKNAEEIVEKR